MIPGLDKIVGKVTDAVFGLSTKSLKRAIKGGQATFTGKSSLSPFIARRAMP